LAKIRQNGEYKFSIEKHFYLYWSGKTKEKAVNALECIGKTKRNWLCQFQNSNQQNWERETFQILKG